MVDGWSGPVGVKGMDAICKHEPLYCALHCHLSGIFVLFRQRSVTQLQRANPPRTCLHEAVCLTQSYYRMDVFFFNSINLSYGREIRV